MGKVRHVNPVGKDLLVVIVPHLESPIHEEGWDRLVPTAFVRLERANENGSEVCLGVDRFAFVQNRIQGDLQVGGAESLVQ